MAEALTQLKQEGYAIDPTDVTHVWPTRFEHLDVYGRYEFNNGNSSVHYVFVGAYNVLLLCPVGAFAPGNVLQGYCLYNRLSSLSWYCLQARNRTRRP